MRPSAKLVPAILACAVLALAGTATLARPADTKGAAESGQALEGSQGRGADSGTPPAEASSQHHGLQRPPQGPPRSPRNATSATARSNSASTPRRPVLQHRGAGNSDALRKVVGAPASRRPSPARTASARPDAGRQSGVPNPSGVPNTAKTPQPNSSLVTTRTTTRPSHIPTFASLGTPGGRKAPSGPVTLGGAVTGHNSGSAILDGASFHHRP